MFAFRHRDPFNRDNSLFNKESVCEKSAFLGVVQTVQRGTSDAEFTSLYVYIERPGGLTQFTHGGITQALAGKNQRLLQNGASERRRA
ncbi:hypothetical protein [Lonsdalea populi]|uniref:hypothetical protein n=1 Tax=Lonsdalea populi TaxID=1172565 RepID=UPI0011607271|nr:hypothetical protein [Lonsdalea populi]